MDNASRSEVRISYRIDASGRIVWVNPAWERFALENDGEAVMSGKIIRRNLFDMIADKRVCGIYAEVITRARQGTVVEFDYRCDAPAWRRTFSMTVTPLGDGVVEFTSTLRHQEARPSVGFLEAGMARDERLLKICSWCQKVATPAGTWLPVEEAVARLRLMEADTFPGITHGMCESCYSNAIADLELHPASPG